MSHDPLHSTNIAHPPDVDGKKSSPSSPASTPVSAAAEESTAPRKRAGRVTKAGKFTPAQHQPGSPLPPAEAAPASPAAGKFDVAVVAEEHSLYRHNRKDGAYFLRGPDGEYIALCWREVKQLLRGVVRMKPLEGEMESEAERLQSHIILHRRVDYVLEGLAGYKTGCYNFQGTKVLVTKAPQLIEPAKGECPVLWRFIHSLLPEDEDGVPQWLLFLAWLRRGIIAVRSGKPVQAQLFILVGTAGDGKSFLQDFVITPCLDGRSADPIDYLTGATQFNAECFSCAHLCSGDPASSLKKDEKMRFKQRLKQVSVGSRQRYHEKGKTAVMLPPVWLMSLSLNSGPDDLALLPPPTKDFKGKVIMTLTAKAEGLPGPAEDEKERFRQTIFSELPAFIHFLLHEFDALPPHLSDDRFGVRSYEHPAIRASLQEQRPEVQLLQMLDEVMPWLKSDKDYWIGKWSALQELLENDSETSAGMERWLKHNPLIQNLSRLADEEPERIAYVRHGKKGGLWKVFPPTDEKPADDSAPI